MRRRQAFAVGKPSIQMPPVVVAEKAMTKKCKYCHRELQRGIFMHEKHCKAK